jgi:hypothetical protein
MSFKQVANIGWRGRMHRQRVHVHIWQDVSAEHIACHRVVYCAGLVKAVLAHHLTKQKL